MVIRVSTSHSGKVVEGGVTSGGRWRCGSFVSLDLSVICILLYDMLVFASVLICILLYQFLTCVHVMVIQASDSDSNVCGPLR